MAKDLETLTSDLDANLLRLERLCAGVSQEQFNWSPAPGRWTIGQNVAHLNLTDGGDTDALRSSIDSGRTAGLTGKGPFSYGLLTRKFVESMEPPATSSFKAPKGYQPPPQLDKDHTVAEFIRIQKAIRSLMRISAGLDLARVKTDLPALPALLRPFIKMELGARFELIATHDRRHLWQAEQVKNKLPA